MRNVLTLCARSSIHRNALLSLSLSLSLTHTHTHTRAHMHTCTRLYANMHTNKYAHTRTYKQDPSLRAASCTTACSTSSCGCPCLSTTHSPQVCVFRMCGYGFLWVDRHPSGLNQCCSYLISVVAHSLQVCVCICVCVYVCVCTCVSVCAVSLSSPSPAPKLAGAAPRSFLCYIVAQRQCLPQTPSSCCYYFQAFVLLLLLLLLLPPNTEGCVCVDFASD